MYQDLAVLAAFGLLYSAVAGGVERSRVSGPMVFIAFGLVSGPLGLGLLDLQITGETLRVLAELTLAVVLFTDAAGADLAVLRRSFGIPGRMLLLALPVTIVLGFWAGALLFPGLTAVELALLATMLAPTDAALGKPVVTNPLVPARLREGLNVESGLNDGLCVPILLVFLEVARGAGLTGRDVALLVVEELGIGLAAGVGLTALAARLVRFTVGHGWTTGPWLQIPVVALAIACFAVAQAVGGSGFIAAFAGGLVMSAVARGGHKHELLRAAEGTGNALALITWVAFGAAVVGRALGVIDWRGVAYAALSLTVLRMLPVLLSLVGTRTPVAAGLFLGWFGPRGLASIVFGIIVANERLPGGTTLSMTAVCTILLSVVAHGVTGNPLAAAIGARPAGEAGGARRTT